MSRSMMVLLMTFEASFTCTRNRFTDRPYSFTSSPSDFPPCLLLFSLDFGVRNIFVSGISTNIPTTNVMIPTGRKVKNDMSGSDAGTSPFALAFAKVS